MCQPLCVLTYASFQAVDVLRQTGKVVRLKLARYKKGPKYHQLQNLLKSQEVTSGVNPNS